MESPLLEVVDLSVQLAPDSGGVRVLDRVSFAVRPGTLVGLVGETGSGKTALGLAVARLLPEPAMRVVGGEVRFRGRDLLRLGPAELRAVRGRELAMVFQEPMSALNPVIPAGEQVAEVVRLHAGLGAAAARGRAMELLGRLGIARPEALALRFPHQLSKGTCQRVAIAIALAARPRLLIADELTASLDATTRGQVLDTLLEVRRSEGMSMLMISHDLEAVRAQAQEVLVVHGGQVAERAPASALSSEALHPYTHLLLAAEAALAGPRARPAVAGPGIAGDGAESGSPWTWPSGCRFRHRCPRATSTCAEAPPLQESRPGHWVACHHPGVRA